MGNVRKCNGCKRELLPAAPPDDYYVLVKAEFDAWFAASLHQKYKS